MRLEYKLHHGFSLYKFFYISFSFLSSSLWCCLLDASSCHRQKKIFRVTHYYCTIDTEKMLLNFWKFSFMYFCLFFNIYSFLGNIQGFCNSDEAVNPSWSLTDFLVNDERKSRCDYVKDVKNFKESVFKPWILSLNFISRRLNIFLTNHCSTSD